jgi:DNA-binding transcriptional LysR family regulator
LRRPADLARHVLLHLDDPEGRTPWLDWRAWLAANGEPGLKPAGSLRFTLYDQVIQAAVGGQGVALGRLPMIAALLRDGRLVAPFPKKFDSARGYYVLVAPHARGRADVEAFVAWLSAEAAIATGPPSARPRGAVTGAKAVARNKVARSAR